MRKYGVYLLIIAVLAVPDALSAPAGAQSWETAARNAGQARQGFISSLACTNAWLARVDPVTGLLPRWGSHSTWYVRDTAADLYPFMVMAAWFTDQRLYRGAMMDILRQEIILTNRVDRLPDNVLAGGGFEHSPGQKRSVKAVLTPGSERTVSSPRCMRMICRERLRPMPEPSLRVL